MEEMNTRILGRKVFFLYPQSVIQEEIVNSLSDQEYEVYILNDKERARSIFRQNLHSICFINIDAILSEDAWQDYIRKLYSDDSLKTTLIGVITNNSDTNLKKKYLLDIGIQCGFINLKQGIKECFHSIMNTLDANEAKGRRKYVRAYCEQDSMASVNFMTATGRITMKLRDISSVGLSCFVSGKIPVGISSHMLIHDIQLTLRGTLIRCDAVVFAIKELESQTVFVMLFTRDMDSGAKTKIRAYVRGYLQNLVDEVKSE